MEEPLARSGTGGLPSAADAGTVLARATDAAVVDVEWCGRRRLPPDDLDVVVYRGHVERAEHERYYAVVAAGVPGDAGTARVFPAGRVDSMTDLVATFQADRNPERVD